MTHNTKNNDSANSFDDEERSMPLSFEESNEAITVAPGAARRRFGFGTMMFASVAVVAIVSLFSMRAIGHADASDATPTEAGALVKSYFEANSSSGITVPADKDPLFMDPVTVRVERDELAKDPFLFVGEDAAIAPNSTGVVTNLANESSESKHARLMEGWYAICDAGSAELRVQSVLVSARAESSMANVNGKVLQLGGSTTAVVTGVSYTVSAIEADGVTFRAWNPELNCERLLKVPVKRNP